MSREMELVERAAEAFEDGRSLDHHFLVSNEVTADECMDLLDTLGFLCRGWVGASTAQRIAFASACALAVSSVAAPVENTP